MSLAQAYSAAVSCQWKDYTINYDAQGRFITPEDRAEIERCRTANEKLDEALLRKQQDLGKTSPKP